MTSGSRCQTEPHHLDPHLGSPSKDEPSRHFCLGHFPFTSHPTRDKMTSKVFIVTGASKGIGAAIAKYLLGQSHKVVVTARSQDPLEALKKSHPDQVEYVAGDMVDPEVEMIPNAVIPHLLTT